ncbi:MAG: LEA type 2 family protein [Magnetococcales bacterium]|nr:LEA type 2 family protein [Magnetococcales bacterium]
MMGIKKWLVVLLSLMLAGCATAPKVLDPPEISLAGLNIVKANFFEQRYRLKLLVENPNAVPLPVSAMKFQLDLDDEPIAKGIRSEPFTVPSYGEIRLSVEVTTDLFSTISRIAKIIKDRKTYLDYNIYGDVDIDLPLAGSIPFDKVGRIGIPSSLSEDDNNDDGESSETSVGGERI